MLDIGISTGFFYNDDLRSPVEKLQELLKNLTILKNCGFNFIEIGAVSQIQWNNSTYTKNLKKTLRELNLTVSSLHAPFSDTIDISDLNELNRRTAVKEIKKAARSLKTLNGSILIIHPSVKEIYSISEEEKVKRISRIKKSLSEILKTTTKLGLRVAVENLLPHILGGQKEVLKQLTDQLPVGICFDTSHANFNPEFSCIDFLTMFRKKIIALHISDNNSSWDDHFSMGKGNIDWEVFLKTLKSTNYSGVFMLEVLKKPGYCDTNAVLSGVHQETKKFLDNYLL
ncbi:MAG: sugar phosphate isomerase/epimerase [Elusimicrobia bacterium]|nr:sugar phosphate isomerase/epimerase [Elusimicrobiota bacterium]